MKKSIYPSYILIILSLSSAILFYYREPCRPSLRLPSAVAIDATFTALCLHLGLLIASHHAATYFGPDRVPSEGTLMAASLAVGAAHGVDTYVRRGDTIRNTLPLGCVCLDDDGNVIARGGGLRKGDKGMAYTSDNDKWRAITTRDAAADGLFVYAVRTTRIYCRPNCKARLARRANVRYYPDYRAAEAGGFRACKRCKPRTEGGMPEDEAVARIRALVGRQEQLAALAASGGAPLDSGRPGESPSMLASQARVSRWHFHRKFKEVTGQTPRAYLKQREKERKARAAASVAAAGGAPSTSQPQSQSTNTTTPSTESDDLFELAAGTPMPDLTLLLREVESNPGQFNFDSFPNSPLLDAAGNVVDMDALCASSGMDPSLFLDPVLWGDLTGGSVSGSPSMSGSGSVRGSGHAQGMGYYMDNNLFETITTTGEATTQAMTTTTTSTTSTTNDTIPYTGS
ncbi:hypothetical protein Sste5346_008409 [Sporothrix stenoceras]|uniref:HTH araC/xylS-type domain-containing protein n=1 Tax=Sporothrix stenoceras TaxID=5173 RepID=A0ABR3YPU9_9PEZI